MSGSVQLATRPNLSVEAKTGVYLLTTPSGEEHQFAGIVDVARWARPLLLNKEISGMERHPQNSDNTAR